MKKYTDAKQTEKLIELGFTPFSLHFSIGDLFEICDDHINSVNFNNLWTIKTKPNARSIYYTNINSELIDCLYDTCLELKNANLI